MTMIQVQLLALLVAGVTACVLAKEATTAPAEEEEELGTAPLGASEGPDSSQVPTLGSPPPSWHSLRLLTHPVVAAAAGEELITKDSISSSSDLGENTTDAELPTTSEDHLETVTLVGIILGTIAAIGVATGLVIALAKKMSGRYSP